MNPVWGWALAALAVALGWWQYGWPGLALAVSVVVFWLLLQFSRALRVMRNAGQAPMGRVDSAVMFSTRLKQGMTLLQVIALTRSLGQRVGAENGEPEQWAWADEGGVSVTLSLRGGKLQSWELTRPDE
jgi:hypothetical protein